MVMCSASHSSTKQVELRWHKHKPLLVSGGLVPLQAMQVGKELHAKGEDD